MKHFIGFGLFMVCIIGVNSCHNAMENTQTELLRKYSTIISDTSFSSIDSFSKLFPEKLFDDKILVGCGQSSHGSHETFEIQKMVFENLAQNHGCRIFIMEACYSKLLIVNKYISEGIGTKHEIMKSLDFWVWDTEEVWELIEWSRKFNSTKPESEKILFLGNDMQDIVGCSNAILDFFSRYNPSVKEKAEQLLTPFLADSSLIKVSHTTKEIKKFIEIANDINDLIQQTETQFDSILSTDFVLQKRNGEMLLQTIALIPGKKSTFKMLLARDSMMALNSKWIIENKFRKGPAFLWAHNGHIENGGIFPGKNMGIWLKSYFGEKYYTIGVDFISGSVNARKLKSGMGSSANYGPPEACKIGIASKSSLNSEIEKLMPALVFLNLKLAKNDTTFCQVKVDSLQPQIHTIGAVYFSNITKEYYEPLDIKKQFDALIFFNFSTPTILLHSKNYEFKTGSI